MEIFFNHKQHKLIEQIITEEQNYLFGVAFYRTRSRKDAEDIVQEAFLRLWERGPLLDSRRNIKLYLYKIVVNICNDRFRKPPLEIKIDDCNDKIDESEDDKTLRQECERVEKLLATLPDTQREVIEMNIRESLSFAEISRITGTPESTLKSRFKAGIKSLGQQFKQDNYE